MANDITLPNRISMVRKNKTNTHGITWQSQGSKTLACILCARTAVMDYVLYANGHRLFSCPNCGTLQYDPKPVIDYTQHTSDPTSVKWYVEAGASFDLISFISTGVAERPIRNAVDIGCGFGFMVYAMRRVFGWNAIGVEMSYYGRDGAKRLGIPIYEKFEQAAATCENFDLVFASEVLEHIENPKDFLLNIRNRMASDALLLLTVPHSKIVHDADNNIDILPALSPGAHVFVPSPDGLRTLLESCSFYVHKIYETLTTLFVVASRSKEFPSLPPTIQGNPQLRANALMGLLLSTTDDDIRWCATLRLMETTRLAELSGFARQQDLSGLIASSSVAWMCDNLIPYGKIVHFGAARGLGAKARVLLHDERDYFHAAQHFLAAVRHANAMIRLGPSLAAIERAQLWEHTFHYGLALKLANYKEAALTVFDELLMDIAPLEKADIPSHSPAPPLWKARALAELHELAPERRAAYRERAMAVASVIEDPGAAENVRRLYGL